MRKKKLRQERPEAIWGAVIGAAGSLLGSWLGGRNAVDSAQAQADAILQASRENAKALEEQNKNNNLLQQQQQKFIAEQNAEARQFQRNMQASMQLQAGQIGMDDRRTSNRIVVKKGGKVRRSSKGLRDASFPLRGGNLPFHVTDGGGVLPLGQTPEGYDLYEVLGNDHDHYHKTRSGKHKTGVGIKFDNGQVVEGEGNQNSNQGEYLLVTPDSGMFISKHSINGFNPAQAVNAGMHPLEAYELQEASKHGSSPVKGNRHKATAGILVNDILPLNYSMYSNDMIRRQLKRGGRCKAWGGAFVGPQPYGYYTPRPYNVLDKWYGTSLSPQLTNNSGVDTTTRWGAYRNMFGANQNGSRRSGISGNLLGAGITSLGNFLGAGLSNIFTNRAAKIGAGAATEAGRIYSDALRNLQTVDMSMLDGENGRLMFSRGHYMPATVSTREYDNAQREDVRRDQRMAYDAAARGSLSSSARISRMAGINSTGQGMLSKIYDATANKEAENRRANMEEINKAAANNLQLDIESMRDRTAARLDLLKYNNDIVNQRLTEPARVEAEALTNAAGIRSNAYNVIGQGWANAFANSGQAFGNAFAMDTKQRNELNMALAGASTTGQYSYYMSPNNYDKAGAYGVYSDFVAMSKSAKDSRNRDEWLYRANQLASKYGFPTV